MGAVKTSLGRLVDHCHLHQKPCRDREFSADEIAIARMKAHYHNPKAVELSKPTPTYNCHGYSFATSHGWFNYPERFMEDDYDRVPLSEAQVGDLVIYKHDDGTLGHSAPIVRVEGSKITELHSKWGDCALLSHSLKGVPYTYGKAVYALRRRAT